MESQAPAQVKADLNRLQEQLYDLYQRAVSAANDEEKENSGGCDAAIVIRGR